MHIQFLGGAGEVTGSKYLIEGKSCGQSHRFLIDYGMFQGGHEANEKNRVNLPCEANAIDFVLLTHAHIDHSGLLPRLCAQGFQGPIFCTTGTAALLKIMLLDSAHLQEADLDRALRKQKIGKWRGDLPEPLYSSKDAYACLNQIKAIAYEQLCKPAQGIEVKFHNAGHILGSATIQLAIQVDEQHQRHLVFSGDLGMFNRPLMKNPELIESTDTLLLESTYGDRQHRTLEDTEMELVEVINETLEHHGNIIMPAFAVGRSQEILFLLSDLVRRNRLPKLHVWVDSPMATAVTKLTENLKSELDDAAKAIYQWQKHHSNALDIRFVADVEESKALNRIHGGAIILSASGMCEAGRILHHLRWNLPHKKNAVIITGFQAQGTLGRRLVDGATHVKMMGKEIAVKASIHTIGGLSAHADQANLIRWLKGFKKPPEKIMIVHGESKSSLGLQEKIRAELHWENIHIPQIGSIFPV
ncbi:MAG: MBL fold metallo-hydrolase [Polynucleobacter sp.]|nr:MBL fold metallo-hydrolase [Polynucleobacter sp.]